MAGITLETAQSRLDQYIAAEEAVLKGQAYQLGGRMMRLPDLAEIRKGIEYWDAFVNRLSANNGQRGMRVRGVTPT